MNRKWSTHLKTFHKLDGHGVNDGEISPSLCHGWSIQIITLTHKHITSLVTDGFIIRNTRALCLWRGRVLKKIF